MLNVLLSGKVIVQPQSRTSGNGKLFVTTTVAVADADCTASVIAFNESARTALAALSKGDSICLTGKATTKVYVPPNGEPRASLDVVAEQVLTQYQLSKKRDSSQPKAEGAQPNSKKFKAADEAQSLGEMPDDCPW